MGSTGFWMDSAGFRMDSSGFRMDYAGFRPASVPQNGGVTAPRHIYPYYGIYKVYYGIIDVKSESRPSKRKLGKVIDKLIHLEAGGPAPLPKVGAAALPRIAESRNMRIRADELVVAAEVQPGEPRRSLRTAHSRRISARTACRGLAAAAAGPKREYGSDLLGCRCAEQAAVEREFRELPSGVR